MVYKSFSIRKIGVLLFDYLYIFYYLMELIEFSKKIAGLFEDGCVMRKCWLFSKKWDKLWKNVKKIFVV